MRRLFIILTIVVSIISIFMGCSQETEDTVTEDNDDITQAAPSLFNIQVTQPNGSEVLDPLITGNETAIIRWKQYGVSTVNIGLSRDGCSTWETIASGIKGSCFTWNVKGPATSSARIKVTSSNPLLQSSDVSDNNFAIIGQYYKTFPGGYCTNFASREFDKVAPQNGRWSGNAQDWPSRASADGWIVSTNPCDTRIRNGTIICWSGGTYGHVGIVRSFIKDMKGIPVSITIEEMNYGKFTIPSSSITTNFGKVTNTTLFTNNLSRGGLYFIGYVFPIRR